MLLKKRKYSGKRLLMQAAGGCINRVPFRERLRGGESERGRRTIRLEEGPLTFWSHFRYLLLFFRVLKSQRNLDMLLGIQFAPPVDQKGV